MPHLGADVAAFVDGQLSDAAQRDASTHLQSCEACEKAVRQQRLLKSRMSTVATPEPPAALLASLAGLAAAPPAREKWWVRLGRSVPLRAGVVLVSASLAVVATAYAVGGAERVGDEVVPSYNRYAADFSAPASSPASAPDDTIITAAAMDDLTEFGWACHETLAGDLHRVSGSFTGDEEVIALEYTDGAARLNLFEQNGALDASALQGFRPETMAGSEVWVRRGSPLVVTWDDDGTVFTIVTDVDRARVEQAVAELPTDSHEQGMGQRVGNGLTRMSSWIDAA
jgi:anti-sigma factor RsiW